MSIAVLGLLQHCGCGLQVLQVLNDPNSPTQLLAANLRVVAASVTIQKLREFVGWLGDGAVANLLDILRRLPDMGLSDNDAAEVCAAAAAGISNIIDGATMITAAEGLQTSVISTPATLRKGARCVDVLRSLVRYATTFQQLLTSAIDHPCGAVHKSETVFYYLCRLVCRFLCFCSIVT
jgi:hypothetical protein